MTMRERISQGKLFTDNCEGLLEDRIRCKIEEADLEEERGLR